MDIVSQYAKPKNPHIWATEVSDRRPKFKTHSGIGFAKSAIKGQVPNYIEHYLIGRHVRLGTGNRTGGPPEYARMFKWENGEWIHVPEFSWELGDPPIDW